MKKSATDRRKTLLIILEAARRAEVPIREKDFGAICLILEREYELFESGYKPNLVSSAEFKEDVIELIRFNHVRVNTRCVIDQPFADWVELTKKKRKFTSFETLRKQASVDYITISGGGKRGGRRWLEDYTKKNGCDLEDLDLTVNKYVAPIIKISELTGRKLFDKVQRIIRYPKKNRPLVSLVKVKSSAPVPA